MRLTVASGARRPDFPSERFATTELTARQAYRSDSVSGLADLALGCHLALGRNAQIDRHRAVIAVGDPVDMRSHGDGLDRLGPGYEGVVDVVGPVDASGPP